MFVIFFTKMGKTLYCHTHSKWYGNYRTGGAAHGPWCKLVSVHRKVILVWQPFYTQHSIAYTVHWSLRAMHSRHHDDSEMHHVWRAYIIVEFIVNVQELTHSLHITDSQLYALVQMKLLSLANKPFTDCVIQSKAVWTGSSYHQRT